MVPTGASSALASATLPRRVGGRGSRPDAPARAVGPQAHVTSAAVVRDFVCLAKPRITVMVVVTGLGGMYVAERVGAALALEWAQVVAALLGLAAVVSGANALNMYLERDSDALMERTANRPLPTGRLAPPVALLFGLSLGGTGLAVLGAFTNPVTSLLAACAFGLYVLAYTPLKRVTSHALVVGAVPGAMPPLLGWTAATGSIGAPGLALFAVLFFWQLPHFVAIATFRSDDYRRAGIRVLPLERGRQAARRFAVIHTVALVASSLVLVPLGVGGLVYAVCAAVLGAAFLSVSLWGLLPSAGIRWARTLFVTSLLYLPALLGVMMVAP